MKYKSILILFTILISSILLTGCFSNKNNNSDFDNYFNQITQNTRNFFKSSKNKNNEANKQNNEKQEIKKEDKDKTETIPEKLDNKYCAVCGLEIEGEPKTSDGQTLCESCWNNRNLGFKPFNSNDSSGIESKTTEEDNENEQEDTTEEKTIPSPVYSDPTLCCLCGNRLEKYWKYENLNYCPDCYDKYILEKCARCNNPLTKFYKLKKKKYCQDCYENYIVERCHRCNNKLIGKYFISNKEKYCENCFENYIASRCYYCNKILDKYYNGNYGKVCENCYIAHEVPKCIICNNPIMAKYYKFPTGKCCSDCFQKHPHCFNCGLPTKFIGFQDDDFLLCTHCNKDKITNKDDLIKLYDKVKIYVKKSCGIEVDVPNENIILSSSSELKDRTKNIGYLSDQRVLGYCYTTYSLSNFYNKRAHTIYLQNGMPYELAFATLAHEYGHAWDHQNKKMELMKNSQDHSFSEGFAEWVKYNTLKEVGYKEKAEQMINSPQKDDDPIYGLGFKKMMKLEDRLNSKSELLEYVKNNNTFKD